MQLLKLLLGIVPRPVLIHTLLPHHFPSPSDLHVLPLSRGGSVFDANIGSEYVSSKSETKLRLITRVMSMNEVSFCK